MKKDPVCGMQINEQQAAGQTPYHGETFYFCSTNCREQFEQNPQRYAGSSAGKKTA